MIEAVIDSSLARAWVRPDETSASAGRLRNRSRMGADCGFRSCGGMSYPLMVTEAQRRKRLAGTDARLALEQYQRLPMETGFELDTESVWRAGLMAT